jgi:hypothetical protein
VHGETRPFKKINKIIIYILVILKILADFGELIVTVLLRFYMNIVAL